ncbi:MAG: hypothetical protein Q8O67_29290 [Deltaproteobacteria bacterium]|nr:hypothetical protein [Deltaproteobacteria bacterium]
MAELVSLLVKQGKTGRLDVVVDGGARSLFFDTGSYTGSTSTFASDRLGEVLWRSGRISLDKLLIAGEQVKEGKLLGRALIELGFLEPKDLRACLVEQAVAVFRAACLEERGVATFAGDVLHRAPLRFGISTEQIVEDAVKEARLHRETLRKVGRLDRPFVPVKAGVLRPPGMSTETFDLTPRTSTLDEGEQALLQLAMSSKEPHTGIELINRSGLGPYAGAQALLALIEKGRLQTVASPLDHELRLRRLCQAITLAMAALDEAGFGTGDQVRELVENPPAPLEEAFSCLSLKEPLDEASVLQAAQFITGGVVSMNAALQAILDEALRQADDTLPSDITGKVSARVQALLAA